MANILAFANQKGGVGKTTSCVNVASVVAMSHFRVLLLDLDPQGNATMGSGVDKNALDVSMNELLQGEVTVQEAILPSVPAGFDLIGANSDLTAAEVVLLQKKNQQQCLKKTLAAIAKDYDFIFLDCPPSLNMLTLNALVAADSVIIPMQCEYYALEGLSDLLSSIEQIKESCNANLNVSGIVRTMYDGRNRLCLEVSNQLLEHFGNKVFQTVIPRNVRLAEAPSHGVPIQLYDKHSRGATAYFALANEMLKRYPVKQTDKVAESVE